MSAFYTSQVRIEKVEGVHRRALLPVGDPVEMGVHGSIAQHFGIEAIPLPLPVDYIVAATAG